MQTNFKEQLAHAIIDSTYVNGEDPHAGLSEKGKAVAQLLASAPNQPTPFGCHDNLVRSILSAVLGEKLPGAEQRVCELVVNGNGRVGAVCETTTSGEGPHVRIVYSDGMLSNWLKVATVTSAKREQMTEWRDAMRKLVKGGNIGWYAHFRNAIGS